MTVLQNPLERSNPLAVRIAWSPVFEAVIAHWASKVELEDLDSFLEREGIEALVAAAGLGDEATDWMGERHGAAWIFLLPLIDESGAIAAGDLADHITSMDAEALFTAYSSAGDCKGHCAHGPLSVDEPAGFKERLEGVLKRIEDAASEEVAAFAPRLRHDAQLTAFLQRRMAMPQLIESVTNGVAYTPEAGVEEIVLVPSVLLRPFNLMHRSGGTLYLVYPASDEAVDADEDTPAAWMVQLFKALADEKRLRLLRHLLQGPQGLMELAEYIGLAKSTTHHHLRLLRAAGLIRLNVSADDESRYELRTDTLPEAISSVIRYLTPGDRT